MRKLVITEIYSRFHSMKTWGKEPETLKAITATMLRDLATFPVDKIMKAFVTHALRSPDFPTTRDIVSLIKRNGRPPLKESDIIAIRRKDAEFRTLAEWQTLREWDDEQNEEWDTSPDKVSDFVQENIRLRTELAQAQRENERLINLIATLKQTKHHHETTSQIRFNGGFRL